MSRRILNGSILGKVCPTGGNPNLISALVLYLLAVAVSPAQTFTTLANFDGANGNGPTGVLIQGSDGGFYGMAGGGANDTCYFLIALYDCGTIFKVTTGGELSTLHSFDGTDGENFTYNWYPAAGLVHATDGNFYGTTFDGDRSTMGQSSKSHRTARSRRCTTSACNPIARTASRRAGAWSKLVTGTSTGRPSQAGRTFLATCSR